MAINEITFTDDGQSYYYMHRHMAHFEKNEAISFFQQQKKMNYTIAKQRYMKNYLSNIISVDGQSLEALNLSLGNEEQFISNLDQEIVDVLNDKVSEYIKQTNYEQIVRKAYSSLNDFLNTKDLKKLDNLFTAITEATSILESKSAVTSLLPLLKKFKVDKNNRSLSNLNEFVNNQIAQIEGQVISVRNEKQVLSVLNSISRLTNDLNIGDIKKNTLQGYLRNIFSTQVGEYLVSIAMRKGLKTLIRNIQNTFSGSKDVTVDIDDEMYEYTQNPGKSKFKTDNSFKNLTIDISEDGSDQVKMNLGISAKWYKDKSGKVSITSESKKSASFLFRLNQLIKKDNEATYYAYNAIGLMNEDNSVYASLKAAMLARNIDVLISGMGMQGDFAQYIVVNGEFYSVWQIIQLIEQYNEGQGSTDEKYGTDPVTISATGASKVPELTEKYKNYPNNLILAFQRAKEQNRLMQEVGFSAHFYSNRFKNLLTK